MEENNKIDELFSKGIEGFSVSPSNDLKKKVFASPSAIKPLKPWYMGANGLLLAGSIITVSVILIYFGINYNNNYKNTAIYNNNINNYTNKNYKLINSSYNISQNKNSGSKNEISNIATENNQEINNINNINQTTLFTKPKLKVPNTNSKFQNPKLQTKNHKLKIESQIPFKKDYSHFNFIFKGVREIASLSSSLIVQNYKEVPNTNEITNNTNNISELTNTGKSSKLNESENNSQLPLVRVPTNQTTPPFVSDFNNQTNSTLITLRHTELVSESAIILMNSLFPTILPQQYAEYMKLISEKPAHYKKGLWYIEANSGMFLTNYKVTTNNNEYTSAKNAKQVMLKTSFGCEMGINAVYQQKKVVFKAGLSYSNIGEKLSGKIFLNNPYNTTSINYNGGYYETIINGNYYDIDSTSYYHYTYTQDSIIHVSGSTLAWDTHNRPVDVLDTVNITKYDTIPETVLYNKIRYVQVPLSVGYAFPFGRFGCTILATVTPGYFVKVNGSQMSVTNYPAIEPYSKNTIKKFALSAGIGVEFNYHLNETLIIGIEPFYRKSILGMYNKDYKLNQNANSYGFRLSIRKLL